MDSEYLLNDKEGLEQQIFRIRREITERHEQLLMAKGALAYVEQTLEKLSNKET